MAFRAGLANRVTDENLKWWTLAVACFALFMAILDNLVVKLTKLSPSQSSYIGVPAEGPYKPEHYRY